MTSGINKSKPYGCKRKGLLLKTKVAIIRAVDEGTKKKKIIAREFGIPATTLSTIMKNRARILEDFTDNGSSQRKRIRSTIYRDVEQAIYKWVLQLRRQGVQLNATKIKRKAVEVAHSLGYNEFCFRNNWYERFQARYGFSFQTPNQKGELKQLEN